MIACMVEFLDNTSIVYGSSGQKSLVKSCQLSFSGSEKSKRNEGAVQLIASSDHSHARTVEQQESRAEKKKYKFTVMSAVNESNMSDECNVRISSLLNQSCYLTALELNQTKENMSSSPDEELESAQKKQQESFLLTKDATEANSASSYTYEDFSYFSDSGTKYKHSNLDNDSQLQYHSAEEESVCCRASYRQEMKTSETFQNKQTNIEGQRYINKLQNKSSKSDSNIFDKYFSEVSEQPHVFQDGKCMANNSLCSDVQGRDEIIGSFSATANKERNPESFLTSKTVINEEMIANSFIDLAHPSVATNRASYKQTDCRSTGVFQRSGSSHVLQEKRTFLPPAHTSSSDAEVSDPCAYKQWFLPNALERNDVYKPCDHCGRYKESFPNSELNCIKYLNNGANKNQSTINQAVDASSDFRACFTTSRATNVNIPVMSRGQNTMITMMNKHRPEEWLTDNRKSVACNTDWSCVSGRGDMSDSQITFENYTTKHGWQSVIEDSLDFKTSTIKDFNEIQERLMLLLQEIANHSPNCCKEIWERAIKAEMQLLKIYYQMYNSWQTYNSVTKEKEQINSSAQGTGNSVSQISSTRDMETSSHLLVAHTLDENSYPQLSLCNDNSEERKIVLEENRSSHTQEISEDWFDAAENLSGSEPSLALKETQTTQERKKESENIFCVHIDSLNPLISEVDLWLCFQRYNVSEISICENSNNCRYASLSFKTACDAKLAVKEMNGKKIRGKTVKVQLLKITQENRAPNCLNFVKKQLEKQGVLSISEKNVECRKNCNVVLKIPDSSPGDPKVPAGSTISPSKTPNASKDSFKSSLSSPTNIPRTLSASSKMPNSNGQSTKPILGSTCFEIDQEDIAEGLLLLGSVHCTPNPSGTFVPPNTLSLRSFHKIVKKLEELHPESSRDNILNALVEIKENKCLLSGLPLSTIIQMASSLLNKNFTSKSNKNQNNLENK